MKENKIYKSIRCGYISIIVDMLKQNPKACLIVISEKRKQEILKKYKGLNEVQILVQENK